MIESKEDLKEYIKEDRAFKFIPPKENFVFDKWRPSVPDKKIHGISQKRRVLL